jgi:hypothetical protein
MEAYSQRWRKAIVGHADVPPQDLLANPWNWKRHTQRQHDALDASLDNLGWIKSITVNQTTGHIVDGHERIDRALEHQEALVPVEYVELTEEEEALALLVVDPIAALAGGEPDRLEALINHACTSSAVLQELITSLATDYGLFPDTPPSLEDLESQYGDPDDNPEAFWKTISLKVPPETWERYMALMADCPGADEAARFAALLRQVECSSTS